MSKWSRGRTAEVLAGLVLVASLGACAPPDTIYTTKGWYLEKPRSLFSWGPRLYKGPLSYDQCEQKRKELPDSTAEQMLCIQLFTAPGPYGPYQ